MRLCVVIPALNEENTICDLVRRIPADIAGISQTVTIVVDDGSTDRTGEVAEGAGAMVVRHSRNRGLGAAFRTGIETALSLGADVVVNMDGDGQFNPEDIEKILKPVLFEEAGFVTACRFSDQYPAMSIPKLAGNLFVSRLISFLTGFRYRDVSCGFRAYSREALLKINLFGDFTYTQETFLDLSFKGVRIKEVPVEINQRAYGDSRVASNLLRYAVGAGKIMFRSFCDHRPIMVFGGLALALFFVALLLGVFFVTHFLTTDSFSPHKWAGFTAAFFFLLGMIAFVVGLLADMLGRIRKTNEKILYLLKRQNLQRDRRRPGKTDSDPTSSDSMNLP